LQHPSVGWVRMREKLTEGCWLGFCGFFYFRHK
jgi:hypothetical protein